MLVWYFPPNSFPGLEFDLSDSVLKFNEKTSLESKKDKRMYSLGSFIPKFIRSWFSSFFSSESKLEPHITYSQFSSLKKDRDDGAFLNRVQLISPDTLRPSLDGLSISSTLKQELENVYQDIRKRHKDELFFADGVGIYKNNLPLLRIDIPSSLQEKRTGVLPGKEYLILTRYEL